MSGLKTLTDILLALLAAFGLLSLMWLLFGRLLCPAGRRKGGLFAVLPVRGDAVGLEYDLAGLRWLRGSGLVRFTVVVADAGLSERGRAVAETLAGREPELLLCPMEGLEACVAAWSGEGA